MMRIFLLTALLLHEFRRSLLGAVPLGLVLFLYYFFFQRSVDVHYFAAIGGFALALICALTTLLLSRQINRAATYPLLLRLEHRSELLAAIVMGALIVTLLLAIPFAGAILYLHQFWLTLGEGFLIALRWGALFLLAAALGLALSPLVNRGVSVPLYGGLILLVTIMDQQRLLRAYGLSWLIEGTAFLLTPLYLLLHGEPHRSPIQYALALLVTLLYTAILVGASVRRFSTKELLWDQ
ncbi:MAG: hypothetical protein H0T73_20990 [Ardenticatenales bacterium]|nr:hypothetical protein [Ardenticatenales bacterium]